MVACNHTSHCSSTDYPNSDGFRFPIQVIEVIRAQDIVSRCRECCINHLLLNESEPRNSEVIQALIEDAESEDRYWRENGSTVHLPDTASQPQDDPAAIVSSRVRRWREERLPLEGFEDYDEENDSAIYDVLFEEMVDALNSEDSLDERLTPTEYQFQEEDGDNPIPLSTFLDHYPFNEWRQEAIAREDAATLPNEPPLVDLATTPVEDRRCGICDQPYLRSEAEGVLEVGERPATLPCSHNFYIANLAGWSRNQGL